MYYFEILMLFQYLQTLGRPHVDSFNYLLGNGLKEIVKTLSPVEFDLKGSAITLKITVSIYLVKIASHAWGEEVLDGQPYYIVVRLFALITTLCALSLSLAMRSNYYLRLFMSRFLVH